MRVHMLATATVHMISAHLAVRKPSAVREYLVSVLQVLLTLVGVFIGYKRVAACLYLALSLWLLWEYLRWVRRAA